MSKYVVVREVKDEVSDNCGHMHAELAEAAVCAQQNFERHPDWKLGVFRATPYGQGVISVSELSGKEKRKLARWYPKIVTAGTERGGRRFRDG